MTLTILRLFGIVISANTGDDEDTRVRVHAFCKGGLVNDRRNAIRKNVDVYVSDRRVVQVKLKKIAIRIGMEVIHRVSGDNAIYFNAMAGISNVIVYRQRDSLTNRIAQRTLLSIFQRVDRLRGLATRLTNVRRLVLMSLKASV